MNILAGLIIYRQECSRDRVLRWTSIVVVKSSTLEFIFTNSYEYSSASDVLVILAPFRNATPYLLIIRCFYPFACSDWQCTHTILWLCSPVKFSFYLHVYICPLSRLSRLSVVWHFCRIKVVIAGYRDEIISGIPISPMDAMGFPREWESLG